LRLDLVESCCELVLARALRNEDACRPGKCRWLKDISDRRDELVDPAGDACADPHFVELYLRCGKLGLRAPLLGRNYRRNACLRRLLGGRCGINLPPSRSRQLFDFTRGNNVSVALL
jgi:hypothetical protein